MAESTAVRNNPNFIRPSDSSRAMGNKNFVSREEGAIRANEVEQSSGVAVRRPGESETAYKKRSKAMERDRGRVRAQMSPALAHRELVSLEKKWADRVPTPEEAERFAAEFEYMNDCRALLGWPEVDYTQPREKTAGDEAQLRFIEFRRKPARERLLLCRESGDMQVMTLAAVHDENPDVRKAAEERMQTLWAAKSAAR